MALYEATFTWPWPANEVIITGEFDNWQKTVRLSKDGQGFSGTVKVPYGERLHYKYVVNGSWTTRDDEPTEPDHRGIVNNVRQIPQAADATTAVHIEKVDPTSIDPAAASLAPGDLDSVADSKPAKLSAPSDNLNGSAIPEPAAPLKDLASSTTPAGTSVIAPITATVSSIANAASTFATGGSGRLGPEDDVIPKSVEQHPVVVTTKETVSNLASNIPSSLNPSAPAPSDDAHPVIKELAESSPAAIPPVISNTLASTTAAVSAAISNLTSNTGTTSTATTEPASSPGPAQPLKDLADATSSAGIANAAYEFASGGEKLGPEEPLLSEHNPLVTAITAPATQSEPVASTPSVDASTALSTASETASLDNEKDAPVATAESVGAKVSGVIVDAVAPAAPVATAVLEYVASGVGGVIKSVTGVDPINPVQIPYEESGLSTPKAPATAEAANPIEYLPAEAKAEYTPSDTEKAQTTPASTAGDATPVPPPAPLAIPVSPAPIEQSPTALNGTPTEAQITPAPKNAPSLPTSPVSKASGDSGFRAVSVKPDLSIKDDVPVPDTTASSAPSIAADAASSPSSPAPAALPNGVQRTVTPPSAAAVQLTPPSRPQTPQASKLSSPITPIRSTSSAATSTPPSTLRSKKEGGGHLRFPTSSSSTSSSPSKEGSTRKKRVSSFFGKIKHAFHADKDKQSP